MDEVKRKGKKGGKWKGRGRRKRQKREQRREGVLRGGGRKGNKRRGKWKSGGRRKRTIAWQITRAKPFLIGALSDENCWGLTPKPLRRRVSQARHHREDPTKTGVEGRRTGGRWEGGGEEEGVGKEGKGEAGRERKAGEEGEEER